MPSSNLKTVLVLVILMGLPACTLNFIIDVESASGRDGEITEQATDSETTTPTVDVSAELPSGL